MEILRLFKQTYEDWNSLSEAQKSVFQYISGWFRYTLKFVYQMLIPGLHVGIPWSIFIPDWCSLPALRASDSIGLEYSLGSSIFFQALGDSNVILKRSRCRGHCSKLAAEAGVSPAVGLVGGQQGHYRQMRQSPGICGPLIRQARESTGHILWPIIRFMAMSLSVYHSTS